MVDWKEKAIKMIQDAPDIITDISVSIDYNVGDIDYGVSYHNDFREEEDEEE
jgi:hypothetical protein